MHLYKAILTFCLLLPVTLHAQTTATPDSSNTNPDKVEYEASFPGGDGGWKNFLTKNLNGNVPADNGAPTGKYTVIVQFIVGRDGSITSIKPLTKFGYGMEEEVMRIIQKSGNWKPAQQNGRAVSAYRKQPVTFLLEQDDFEIVSQERFTLFTGIDNEITVNAHKVKNETLSLTISKGTVKPTADGKFIVKVNSPGRVIITVYNSKTDRQIGAASFEVVNK